MPVTVVVGGQFGSEGKGKVAHFLAKETGATIASLPGALPVREPGRPGPTEDAGTRVGLKLNQDLGPSLW